MFVFKYVELLLTFLLNVKLYLFQKMLPLTVYSFGLNLIGHAFYQLKLSDEIFTSILLKNLSTCLICDLLETFDYKSRMLFVVNGRVFSY